MFNVSASVVPTKAAAVENDDETFDETINMISTTEKEIDLKRRHKDRYEIISLYLIKPVYN